MSTKLIFQVIEKALSLAFLCLGCVFIYQGEILQRFNLKRTNFARSDEDISELPVIYTSIMNLGTEAHFGTDFNISYEEYNMMSKRGLGSNNATILTKGHNVIGKGPFKVNFEQRNTDNVFLITPINFAVGMHQEYVLTFIFKNSSLYQTAKFGIIIMAQNNSYIHCLGNYYDGKVSIHRANIGEYNWLILDPEKYSFNENIGKCRNKPYQETLFAEITSEVVQKCSEPCRPKCVKGFGSSITDMIEQYPLCQTVDQELCFYEVLKSVKETIIVKPCSKMQYKVHGSTWKTKSNQGGFVMRFLAPPRVIVYEEYLDYDLVAMISAIGGTLSLFIGFSFRDLAHFFLRYIERGVNHILMRSGIKGSDKGCKQLENDLTTVELGIQCKRKKTSRQLRM